MPRFSVRVRCLSATEYLSGTLSVEADDAVTARQIIEQHIENLLAIFDECKVEKVR